MEVHRCRIIPWMPSGVSSICFNWNGSEVAVARQNGDIEFRDVTNGWLPSKKIFAPANYHIKGLVWIGKAEKSRLFSTGLHGRISEWNRTELREEHWSDTYGGAGTMIIRFF